MIVRIWRGQTTAKNADAYRRHVTDSVFPTLEQISGHIAAYLLQRKTADHVEFLVVTLWESIEAVKKFAGADPDVAVVEPEARAVLVEFDDFARNYEVTHGSLATP